MVVSTLPLLYRLTWSTRHSSHRIIVQLKDWKRTGPPLHRLKNRCSSWGFSFLPSQRLLRTACPCSLISSGTWNKPLSTRALVPGSGQFLDLNAAGWLGQPSGHVRDPTLRLSAHAREFMAPASEAANTGQNLRLSAWSKGPPPGLQKGLASWRKTLGSTRDGLQQPGDTAAPHLCFVQGSCP